MENEIPDGNPLLFSYPSTYILISLFFNKTDIFTVPVRNMQAMMGLNRGQGCSSDY